MPHVFICQRCTCDFTAKYVGMYFNFGWELQSADDGQKGKSILHVLIIDIKKMFLFSLGMKELVGKDTDLQLIPLVCKENVDVHVGRYGTCCGTFLKGIL